MFLAFAATVLIKQGQSLLNRTNFSCNLNNAFIKAFLAMKSLLLHIANKEVIKVTSSAL